MLAAGAVAGLLAAAGRGSAPDRLTLAACILTISDSLVLWRLGAAWNPEEPGDRRKLRIVLVGILLLYYLYMGILISLGAPFVPGNG